MEISYTAGSLGIKGSQLAFWWLLKEQSESRNSAFPTLVFLCRVITAAIAKPPHTARPEIRADKTQRKGCQVVLESLIFTFSFIKAVFWQVSGATVSFGSSGSDRLEATRFSVLLVGE